MKVLIACEESQVVCEAFRMRGHDAISADVQIGAKGLPHYWGDITDLLDVWYDLVIFHPPCTYICNAGVQYLHKEKDRWDKLNKACDFFNLRHRFKTNRICTENPVPHKYAVEKIGAYDQIFQPWHFGHREMKANCLWLKGLPALLYTDIVGPPPKEKKARKSWQRMHNISPGKYRARIRSETYSGIAHAMALQWGSL